MRESKIIRNTRETKIQASLNIDGKGQVNIESGIGFFDHMLTTMCFYADFDLDLQCQGDLYVDSHHTVEDIGLVLGSAFNKALGEKKGIKRFASAITPMDESLALVAIDISNRPFMVENITFKKDRIGDMDSENFKEFFRAFAFNSSIGLHIDLMRGENDHHKIEAVFKGLGLALREAIEVRDKRTVSTKGVL